MFVKILGVLDIIIAIILFLSMKWSIIPSNIILTIGIYLIAKSMIFIWGRDIASMLELVLGVTLIASAYIITIHPTVLYIIAIYFVLKGAFSMIG